MSVTQDDESVFYGSEWALMKINKSDLSLEYFSKVEGLSDVGVRFVKYSPADDVLLIIYENSNIDLIFEDEIVNLNQITVNSQIVKDRSIAGVYIKSPYAYFATGFGLVQLDLQAREFGFTTFSDLPLNGVSGMGGELIITTDEGIYTARDDGSVNLADFSAWRRLGFVDGLPELAEGKTVTSVDGSILLGVGDEVYQRSSDRFQLLHREPGHTFGYALASDEGLMLGWLCNTCINGKKILIEPNGNKTSTTRCADRAIDAIIDEAGRVWYADLNQGYKYTDGFKGACQVITPNRPPTHNASQIATYDRKLYVATGGITINYGYLFRQDGFYTNASGEWESFNRLNVPVLAQRDMRDFLTIKISSEGIVYVGTFWDGLIEYKQDQLIVYDQSNSSLQNSVINPDRNRITDMDFDQDGNLWILNHDAPRPLSVLTKDGQWQNFAISLGTNPEHIACDHQGFKWISIGGKGLYLLDTGEDLMNEQDDQSRTFTANNSALTSNSINDIAVDRDGTVWVGTTIGPVRFQCGPSAFDNNCMGARLIVVQNGIAGELLGEENVRTIAVDGGNRKWFGTTNGVFVQSPDAETQVHAFNEANSPLFDNTIIDIEIDPIDGETFIATNKGILSYRGEAIEGGRFHQATVYAFPNPVRPEYDGPIAIKGLAENANVKITDVAGLLVFETRAIGGQAIWNGKDLAGQRAASGVYLVFSTAVENQANPDAAVAKIMLIN